MAYDKLIVTVTLVGSLLSFVATSCVLISWVVYREQQRSFRHALVLNLAIAGKPSRQFINSLNNSISGIINVRDHALSPSPACTLNGWIGQLSVQAADFSILAIALVTVLTITRKTYMPDASLGRKVMICTSVWIVPIITSSTAAGLHTMAPVSGNWCWITSQRTDLRYALGHGWRFAIMFITIGVYIYVWWYMRQHFQTMAGTQAKGSIDLNATSSRTTNRPRASFATCGSNDVVGAKETMERKDSASTTYDEELQLEYARMPKSHLVAAADSASNFPAASGRPPAAQFPGRSDGGAINAKFTFNVRDHHHHSTAGREEVEEEEEEEEEEELIAPDDVHIAREIRRMLLLNAYPIMWVLLWLPGMTNRLLEATGHKSKALAVLQSSTKQ
ncbi:hypothetical protein SLS58_008760 [Diplodia intermedia]|uniref:Glucose receptor Git3-like N-terminal domain-containing protein n=1 Tax=Diplodia intermedia TaxID=856260 RepID=A0ABR3TGP7_9PEZI